MQDLQRRYKSLLQRHENLKRVVVGKDRELLKLRKALKVQILNDEQPNADLITNIKNYLESELVLDLATRQRSQPLIKGRCMFYWFAKRYTDLTLTQIASHVGNVDHSTVIHGLAICGDYIEQNKTFAKDLKRFDDYILHNLINGGQNIIEDKDAEIQKLRNIIEDLNNKFVNVC